MSEKLMNRSYVVVGALLIQLSLGAIYAWSAFTTSLTNAGWTKSQTQAVFSTELLFFALVMILAGQLKKKIGPRSLAILGGFLFGIGKIIFNYTTCLIIDID